jgi:signal transduction histidine kinase
MKAMPDGGSLRVTAAFAGDRRNVRINFDDTGVGMSEAQIQAAMSGFVNTQSGTGLGVMVSLLLLRAQNGNLEIESREGVGTKVIVSLPTIQKEITA